MDIQGTKFGWKLPRLTKKTSDTGEAMSGRQAWRPESSKSQAYSYSEAILLANKSSLGQKWSKLNIFLHVFFFQMFNLAAGFEF